MVGQIKGQLSISSKSLFNKRLEFQNALGGSAADFTTAREYADKVIAAHPMVANYKDLFPKRMKM